MEKLAIGLILISLFYVTLLFSLAYSLDQWPNLREKVGNWFSLRKKAYPVLKEPISNKTKGRFGKAA